MRVLNWHLVDTNLIDGLIAADNSGQLGRTDLARRLCELMKWCSMDGVRFHLAPTPRKRFNEQAKGDLLAVNG